MAIRTDKKKVLFDKYRNNLLILFLIFITGVILYQGLDKAVEKWEFPEKQPYMLVETSLNVLHTSNDTIYIGRTNNYLFFFLKKQSISMVVPSNQVNRIYLKKGKKIDTTRKYPPSIFIFP